MYSKTIWICDAVFFQDEFHTALEPWIGFYGQICLLVKRYKKSASRE